MPKKKSTKVKKNTKSTKKKKTKKNKKAASKKTSSAKRKRAPESMEELLETTGYKIKGWRKGSTVKGEVTSVTRGAVLVDIGAKTEGIVIGRELEKVKDFIDQIEVGQEIEAIVNSPGNDQGQILLSLTQAADDYKWNLFEKYFEDKKTVEVRGLKVNKGGLVARVMDVHGFVPASQLGRKYLGKPYLLQNKVFEVKVIEVDRKQSRLIFSEKQVSEAEAIAAKQKALKKVKKDKEYTGKVSGIMPFGIFVQVPIGKKEKLFLEGLVHISEISWERVGDLNKLFKVGQKVKVQVLDVNEDEAKLNLSMKRLEKDPWREAAEKYPQEKKTTGTVTRLVAFGAFVELEPGVEGLVHISKIPAEYNIKVGKKVKVYVESIDLDKRRMSLGLMLQEKPVGYK